MHRIKVQERAVITALEVAPHPCTVRLHVTWKGKFIRVWILECGRGISRSWIMRVGSFRIGADVRNIESVCTVVLVPEHTK